MLVVITLYALYYIMVFFSHVFVIIVITVV